MSIYCLLVTESPYCCVAVGEDPDELEVYGTDTPAGPLLTSYKFEVQTLYCVCLCVCVRAVSVATCSGMKVNGGGYDKQDPLCVRVYHFVVQCAMHQ